MNNPEIIEKLKLIEIPGFKWNDTTRDLDEVKVKPTVIPRERTVSVSAEDGKGFADFFGEFRGGYPWIHPDLEAFAKEHKCHWEWDDPGSISIWEGV